MIPLLCLRSVRQINGIMCVGSILEKEINSPLIAGTISTETFCEKFASLNPLHKPQQQRPSGLWTRKLLV